MNFSSSIDGRVFSLSLASMEECLVLVLVLVEES